MVLKVEYADDSALADATENLSGGGFFIQTSRKFEIGRQLGMKLSFPGLLNPVQILGTVAWKRGAFGGYGAGVGVRVEDETHRAQLERLLSAANQGEEVATKAVDKGFRVLIVEDNPHIVEMYSYVLKKLASQELKGQVPLEVHFAGDGHAALQLLHDTTFNLVMTDLYMPVMDGFALVERIRGDETLRAIPVVAISADKDSQERALKSGVDIFLKKPVRFAEVLETVKRLLHIQ
jgi:uncharacterized protein (TIGR02266 family)